MEGIEVTNRGKSGVGGREIKERPPPQPLFYSLENAGIL
jgi:hypothetical protein